MRVTLHDQLPSINKRKRRIAAVKNGYQTGFGACVAVPMTIYHRIRAIASAHGRSDRQRPRA
jgi:hypothetical protein